MDHNALIESLLATSSDIRYVAVGRGQSVELGQRAGLADSSSNESDRYEELLVNPALILLTRQRGEIDCGGLEYLVVRYGNFFQVVVPLPDGHVSVAVEPDADPHHIADVVIAQLDSTT